MNIRPEITGVWDYLYWNLAKIFIAGKSSIGSGPLWFVFTLYSVSLMFYGVMVITKRIELWIPSPLRYASRMTRSRMTVAGIAIASLIAGWLLYKNHIRLPLGIERDLTVLFFFYVRMDLPRTDKEFIERFLRTSSAQRHPIHGPSALLRDLIDSRLRRTYRHIHSC